MLLFGVLGIGVGALWAQVFPLNKFLWTSSYVVYTAGFAVVCLGAVYWLIDLRRVRGVWDQPWVWLGMNPLVAYCGSQVMFIALQILYIGTPPNHTHLIAVITNTLFGANWEVIEVTNWHNTRWPALIWALICLSFWTMITGLMYRRRLFVKI
jgi:predicted acyltransferase